MRFKLLFTALGMACWFGVLFGLIMGPLFGFCGLMIGLMAPYIMAGPKEKTGVSMVSYIIHPAGRLFKLKVSSHRAFRWRLGLYGVEHIFTLPDGERMMLHSAGNPAPWGSGSKGESIKIGEQTFISGLLEVLSLVKGRIRRFTMPSWLMAILIMALVLVIIWMTKKP